MPAYGDLGRRAPEDVLLLLSTSGETQTLIEILPTCAGRGTGGSRWLGRLNSSLARAVKWVLMAASYRGGLPN